MADRIMVGIGALHTRGLRRFGGTGVVFVLGLLVGAAIGPVSAVRSTEVPPTDSGVSPSSNSGRIRSAMLGGSEHVPFALRGQLPAEVTRVIDGDTFEARVHVWPGIDITTRVRLRGIDAPEFKARCMEERVKAEAARDRLQAVLDEGEVFVSRIALDKYGGRVLAAATTRRTADVSAALLQAGLARSYDGGRRDGWCP
jgi:endonuclease YncB( thermonuclease family)